MKRMLFAIAALAIALSLAPSPRAPVIVLAQSGNVELVSGWTGPLDFRLLADGAALNLTGMTVELLLTDANGAAISTTGDTAVTDAANGVVRYTPDSTDLLASGSPIRMRWKVTDGTAVVYHPSARPATIVVHEI